MLLGASLAKGPTWRAAPPHLVLGVALSKLTILPVAALAACALLVRVARLPPRVSSPVLRSKSDRYMAVT